jgi:cytosine/adenosine deaminase-related metal-dependent hydrolase
MELYGETADVATAKRERVKMAIAPDWSVTGSGGMLQELKFASDWNEGQTTKVFQDADLVRMATTNPAALAGLKDKIGMLAPDKFADLLVIKWNSRDKNNAFKALLRAKVSDVDVVVIGGSPVYGNPEMIRAISPNAIINLINVCGVSKGLNFETEQVMQGRTPKPWSATTFSLEQVLRNWGLSLSPLADCAY